MEDLQKRYDTLLKMAFATSKLITLIGARGIDPDKLLSKEEGADLLAGLMLLQGEVFADIASLLAGTPKG